MEIIKDINGIREKINEARKAGKRIGFVPTMGYLHQGHLSLVEIAKKETDYQVMSIFVNKMQFNDKNDYKNYPREYERDFAMAEKAGVDLMFTPDDEIMYINPLTYVDMDSLTEHLCGAHREGHFRGVFTVVSKLFNIVQPDVSVFGQKDIQQAIGIEKMVFDLNFPVKIIIAPIMREKEGLAMSSRNKHLSEEQIADALYIYKSLQKAEVMIESGETESGKITFAMRKKIQQGKPDRIDYVSVVDYKTLQPVRKIGEKNVIAVAAYFGTTRLIDNMIVEKKEKGYLCTY
ncbi:pantoate--beta-alanine ligase [Candidatus Woesearchaeota archaeon]|nr:pantoate--beta-alanine ligase [Candidatus Woesearchaeota archaeon]